MKTAKIILVVLLALGIFASAYFTGYHFGKRDDDRMHLHLNLDKDVYLYHEAERGDLAAVKTSLGFFTFADYDFYERHYGGEKWSPERLQEAHRIAAAAAANDMVWFTNIHQLLSEITNRLPDKALEPAGTTRVSSMVK